jgi:diacylglycerol O-acyltransferase / wax synthase
MAPEYLSALDRSFLEVETPTAHMHVGWAAVFDPPPERSAPSFEVLRTHIENRLHRAPRYRQKLARIPFDLSSPVWIDDDAFDIGDHVCRSALTDLGELVDDVMSRPLDRGRPLWQMWIADLADGGIGLVGKAHHCMVDGIAAVKLATLLLDPTPQPSPGAGDHWRPDSPPDRLSLLAAGVRDRVARGAELATLPGRLVLSPRRMLGFWEGALRAGRALVGAGAPTIPRAGLNAPISERRHLARARRPLADLRRIKLCFGTTVNDVLLAASAGALRRHLGRHGEPASRVKAMVPVNLRDASVTGDLGNRISFVFVALPCDEPDPVRRLRNIHLAMSSRKDAGEPEGAGDFLSAVSYAPHTMQRAVSRVFASPWIFNLTISNIPGPRQPVYMLGCELDAAYPVVPISDGHGVSIGMTTIKEDVLFGVYADRQSVPDADALAEDIDRSIDELLELCHRPRVSGPGTPAPAPV